MASSIPMGKHRNRIIEMLVFILALAVAAAMVWRYERGRYLVERSRVSDLAGDYAHALQSNIERSLSATFALAALVRQGNGAIDDFEATAREMLPFFPGAASLQLAPGGVVRQIVPLAGNEGAIGHDLFNDPKRRTEAIQARDSKKLSLAGPFALKQGGFGAVGRFPVFLDKGAGGSSFWGFTNVLIRFPEVLDPVRLASLEKRGFGYMLWRVHPDSGERQIIAASASAPLMNPVDRQMELPNGVWTLSVAPLKGWGEPVGVAPKAALGVMFALLVYLLTRSQLNTRAQASLLAAQLTKDLTAREQEFCMVFEHSPVSIWEEDFSGVRAFLDDLKTKGITDIEQYLNEHADTVRHCAERVRIINVNRAALALHGAADKEELLAGLVSTFTQDSYATFREELICIWRGETEFSADAVVKTFAGNLRHVTVYFSVCPGYEQSLSKVLISLVDITNRKLVEDTLRYIAQLGWAEASDGFFASLARYLGGFLKVDYVVIDRLSDDPHFAETVSLYARGTILPNMKYALRGTPCDNVIGKRLCCYPQGVQSLFPEDTLLAEMGVESYAGVPLWDASGNCMGLIAVMDSKPMHDEETVTQALQLVAVSAAAFMSREQSDRLLRQSEERYRSLVDNIDLGITLIDKDHRIIMVNQSQAEMFHQPAEVFFGKYCYQEFEKRKGVCEHCPGIPAMADRRPKEVVTEGVRDDGSRFTVRIRAFPLAGTGELSGGFIEVVEDITEQKKMQDELDLYRKHLEVEVQRRTVELTAKTAELERMNRLFVGRELRMIELKEQIRDLESRIGG